ncbi:hypothetical protein HY384_00185 [Candidatus Daviesbacteria bacterium]|nr:hypothetical protein [Candidatus Daviesbacteria bacterium]
MFSTLKMRLILGIYVLLILSIPAGAYLVSQNQTSKSSASQPKTESTTVKTTPKPTLEPSKELLKASQKNLISNSSETSPTPQASATTATSFGPTLNLKISIEGRTNDQSTRLFVGIMEGMVVSNPKFLLTFSVNLPSSGEYSNLSLAGLTSGTKYTAILKSSAQIATSSAFIMSPAATNLNNNSPINLLSGDLNDDNTINSSDYSIAQKALGSTATSANWNANADLNKDGTVNIFDLSIITKNIGKIGDSGSWASSLPKVASSSASLSGSLPVGSPPQEDGYWIWIPKY